jgi:isopropylmalate/homocitrate/citramalate synthase
VVEPTAPNRSGLAITSPRNRVKPSDQPHRAERLQGGIVIALCRRAGELGYRSLSFTDTFFRFGITPEGLTHLIRAVRTAVPESPPLYIHLSNLYGNATMTAVAALAAGATAPDVSMNGIGHHGGHTFMVLEALYGIRTGIRLDRLREVALLVSGKTGIPLPPTSPLMGAHAFVVDGPTWVAEGKRAGTTGHGAFPFDPIAIGNLTQVVWSERTMTPDAVRGRLAASGLPTGERVIAAVIGGARGALHARTDYPHWLADAEFEALCREVS